LVTAAFVKKALSLFGKYEEMNMILFQAQGVSVDNYNRRGNAGFCWLGLEMIAGRTVSKPLIAYPSTTAMAISDVIYIPLMRGFENICRNAILLRKRQSQITPSTTFVTDLSSSLLWRDLGSGH